MAVPTIFSCGLLVVTLFTQRLMVVLVPKQVGVASVRYDVINDRCPNCESMPFAFGTEGVIE